MVLTDPSWRTPLRAGAGKACGGSCDSRAARNGTQTLSLVEPTTPPHNNPTPGCADVM